MNSRHRRHGVRPCRLPISGKRKSASPFGGVVAFAISALFTVTASAQSTNGAVHQHAHVHGVAKLGIAMQGKVVTISFESPLDSLIGFEHRPGSPAEQAAAAALQARMRAPRELFQFNAEAACSLVKAQGESAIFGPAPAAAAGDEHADLDASFEYSCAQPAKLATVDTGLFKSYPRLHKLDVEIATDKGQFKQTLTSPAHLVALVR
ncbi:MAG: DUF2796 domain-containing protein [Caldimonas sp.]